MQGGTGGQCGEKYLEEVSEVDDELRGDNFQLKHLVIARPNRIQRPKHLLLQDTKERQQQAATHTKKDREVKESTTTKTVSETVKKTKKAKPSSGGRMTMKFRKKEKGRKEKDPGRL